MNTLRKLPDPSSILFIEERQENSKNAAQCRLGSKAWQRPVGPL